MLQKLGDGIMFSASYAPRTVIELEMRAASNHTHTTCEIKKKKNYQFGSSKSEENMYFAVLNVHFAFQS
jgi:hypothetical protein